MRNYMYILVACLLWATPVLGQDLEELDKDVKALGTKFKELAKQSKHKEDSLQKELLIYKVKEGYFTAILGGQLAMFSAIVALLGLATVLITWGGIYSQVSRLEKEYKKETEKLEIKTSELQNLINDFTFDSLIAHTNFYVVSALKFGELTLANKEAIVPSFTDFLSALFSHFKAMAIKKDDYIHSARLPIFEVGIQNILILINTIEELKSFCLKDRDRIIDKIDKILEYSKNEPFYNQLLELKLKILKLS